MNSIPQTEDFWALIIRIIIHLNIEMHMCPKEICYDILLSEIVASPIFLVLYFLKPTVYRVLPGVSTTVKSSPPPSSIHIINQIAPSF